jgi:NAD dependent epimerase/dehydratase
MMGNRGTVLVTGAAGFIGSHLVEGLLRAGYRVRAFARYNSQAARGWLAETPSSLPHQLEMFFGDITDARAVREAVRGCSRIYHLAALIGIPYSYVAPHSYVNVNIIGTQNILEAAREEKLDRVAVTSTSEVYGTALYTPIDEDHPYQAQSPYAATKVGADQLALSYWRTFATPVLIVRPFNTYGPRQSTRAIIPTVITQALQAEQIVVGSTSPTRDMVFVEDTVAGFLALADSEECLGKVTNLATGVGVSVGEIIERVLALTGKRIPIVEQEERKRPANSEVFTLLGKAEAARQRAGWSPRVSLDEGLGRAIAWFKTRRLERVSEYRV